MATIDHAPEVLRLPSRRDRNPIPVTQAMPPNPSANTTTTDSQGHHESSWVQYAQSTWISIMFGTHLSNAISYAYVNSNVHATIQLSICTSRSSSHAAKHISWTSIYDAEFSNPQLSYGRTNVSATIWLSVHSASTPRRQLELRSYTSVYLFMWATALRGIYESIFFTNNSC